MSDWLELLHSTARSMHRLPEPGLAWDGPPSGGELRPGDDFNARACWDEILQPAGWVEVTRRGKTVFWRRPGKDGRTWSATTGHCVSDAGELLYVFSANAAPFAPMKSYSRFAAYTLLNHAGDYKAAARALAGKGYGAQRPHPSANGSPAIPREPPAWEPPIPLAAIPQASPFPLEVLPPDLQRFVREVSEAKHAPLDYAAVPLLVVAGGAIGSSRAISIKPGWSERPCLYAAVVAPPGSAKTPALKDIAGPVYTEQARLRAAHRTAKENDDRAKLRTVYVSDITTEALANLLQENDRGVVMIRDELTAWATSMDQYKAAGKGADRQVYLHSWSGEPISVHRKLQEDGPIFVGHPFIGIVGGLPPSSLSKLCGSGGNRTDDGFLDRILFTFPEPTPAAGEDWRCVSDESAARWADTLRTLWGLEQQDDEHGGKRPRFLRLDGSGRAAWERFTHGLAAAMNQEDFPDFFRGPWSKLRSYAARLALIVHCLWHASGLFGTGGDEVGAASIERAADLVAYFQSHARKVYAAFDADPQVAECKRVLRWIAREKRKEFHARDVIMDLAGAGIRNTEDLDRLLSRLIRHHYVRAKDAPQREGCRPASPIYEVNPIQLTQEIQARFQKHPPPTNPTNPTNFDRKPGEEG